MKYTFFQVLSQITPQFCKVNFETMNSWIRIILVSLFCTFCVNAHAQKEKKIEWNELPQKAQTFINKNFTKEKAQHIIKESGKLIDEGYDVVFKNTLKIKFDKFGDWIKIDGKREPIPEHLIPDKITKYIHRSFPNNQVVKIEKSRRKYEVEISNGLELEFDKNGNFIRIDS